MPAGSLALAFTWALLGPPTLPPLPGERPPEPPAEPAPTKPDAAKPTTPTKPKAKALQPTPAKPAPAKPTPTKPAPAKPAPTGPSVQAPPPAPAPAPTSTPPPKTSGGTKPPGPGPSPPPSESELFGVMEPPEPPQPEPRGPQSEDETDAESESGEGGRRGSRAPVADGSTLPGGDDERKGPALRFPAPVRPPFSGLGLFIGAGVSFSASLAEQIVAHVLVKRRCIDPFAMPPGDPMNPEEVQDEAEDYAQRVLQCAPGVLPAVALRVYSDVGLLTTIGLVAGGASMRARQRAYDDVSAGKSGKPKVGLRIAGASLVGVGVVTWLTTGAVSWGMLASCRDAQCATRARLMAFTTRDTGAVLVAAGAGMLSYSFSHRRAYDRFLREHLLSVGTAWLPGGAGLSLSGRF